MEDDKDPRLVAGMSFLGEGDEKVQNQWCRLWEPSEKLNRDSFIEGLGRPLMPPPGIQGWCQAGMLCCLSLPGSGHHTSAVPRPLGRLEVSLSGQNHVSGRDPYGCC